MQQEVDLILAAYDDQRAWDYGSIGIGGQTSSYIISDEYWV